jgi:hypothetical protein
MILIRLRCLFNKDAGITKLWTIPFQDSQAGAVSSLPRHAIHIHPSPPSCGGLCFLPRLSPSLYLNLALAHGAAVRIGHLLSRYVRFDV